MKIIDGRKIRDDILAGLKEEVFCLPYSPIFCDILIGDDSVSASYIRIKSKTAESIGIKFKEVNFDFGVTTEIVVDEIENLNKVPYMCGIIVQLPIPDYLEKDKILDRIETSLDVDCLGKSNSLDFYNNKPVFVYPTALAVVHILDSLKLDLENKDILVLGQGKLVGRPVYHILENRGYRVSFLNSKTENSEELIKNADVIISAIGRGNFISSDMVKDGVVIIDAGTSEDAGSIVGDIDIDSFKNKDAIITPCPGGVGPVTVAMLLKNVINVAKQKININE